MLLVNYLQLHRLPAIGGTASGGGSIDRIGQFALGDRYVVQLMNGNSIDIPELTDIIDIICGELRVAPNYDVEVFAGTGRVNNKTIFVVPRQELGRPFGRNLRRLRENLTLWMATYSLSGEMPSELRRERLGSAQGSSSVQHSATTPPHRSHRWT